MPHSLEPGEQVERYRVESVLGEGGAARVYRVRHVTLGTVHALKVLTVDHPTLRKRLLSEGRAQAQLSHPNLVPVRDVLELADGPALLMDFVPGPTLWAVLSDGGIRPDAAIDLFRDIAKGVGYAHGEGLIHRDLKPGNVLLDNTTDPPVPRITDFGLVRMLDSDEASTRHTRAGMAMGTLGYMAPEQIRDARETDARSDIFALGALFYTMLAGRAPFRGDDQLQIMNATVKGEYYPIEEAVGRTLSDPIRLVISKCLQVDPAERFQSVRELLGVLDQSPSSSEPRVTMDALTPSVEDLDRLSRPTSIELDGADEEDSTVCGLVVDPEGRGHVVRIAVAFDPNGSGVQHAPGVARDAQVAAQLAVAVALGDQASDMGVRWAIRGSTDALHGTSLGLPLAIAVWCAHRGKSLPDGWAFTGGLDLDGRVAPVSGVPAKVRAASAHGLERVVVPADGLGALEAPAGLEVIPSRTFTGLIEQLFPAEELPPTRPWRRRLLWMLIPLMVAFTGLSSRVEPLLHDPLIRWMQGPLKADNTAILAFPPQRDARELRAQHPAVIDGLVAAGARTIFFDVTMTALTEHDDEVARAIRDARSQGVAVVMPVVMEAGQVMLPRSESIQDAAWFGPVLAQADIFVWHVRRALVRIRTLNEGDYWHAAVQSARGHLSVDELPRIEDDVLVIGPNRNPIWADLVYLHPAEPSPVYDYSNPEEWAGVKGRTVLIGEMGGSDDIHQTDAETVYGVEIEAALIETLLQQRAPRVASPELGTLLSLIVGFLTAFVGIALPRHRWSIAWIVPVATAAISLILISAGVLVPLLPLALAAGIGLWVGRTPVVTPGQNGP